MKNRPVSIVVLSKYYSVFEGFLKSIGQFSSLYRNCDKVLVMDGGKFVDHQAFVAARDNWNLIPGPDKFSMAGNGNLGLRAAAEDSDILYCGDDIRFLQPDTVELLQKVAYFNSQIGILSPRLKGRSSPALAAPPESSSFSYVRPIEMWFPCVYIKREVLNKVGYLDEQFNDFGGDDLDYCIRVQQAGYKLAVTPRVTVEHEASPEGGPTTFVKNLGMEEWQRQQAVAFEKLQAKYKVDMATFDMFLRTNDMRLLDPSAPPATNAPTVTSPAETAAPLQQIPQFPMQGKRGFQGKSLFIMTPMYGGQCTMNWVTSFIQLILACQQYQVSVEYLFLNNESLITRARNRMVDHWLKKTNATHGLFIDADIGFDPHDVMAMLDIDLEVAGAPCVKKCIRYDRIRELVQKNGQTYSPEDMAKVGGDFILNFEQWSGRKVFNLGEPQAAHSVGTGLMMIKREVVERMATLDPTRYYEAYRTDPAALPGKIYDYFQVGVNPETHDYDSEDYRFCIEARKAGFGVWIIPWMSTTHAGTHVFQGDLPTMARLMPEWVR